MRRETGFGMIAAIVVLVILAALAGAMTAIGTGQQLSSAQDVMSARAWQAARAGNEWGLYQALGDFDWNGAGTRCANANQTQTLDLQADTGFMVTVSCRSWLYNEGETQPGTVAQVRIFEVQAIACPAANCPAAGPEVAGLGYIERRRVVVAQRPGP